MKSLTRYSHALDKGLRSNLLELERAVDLFYGPKVCSADLAARLFIILADRGANSWVTAAQIESRNGAYRLIKAYKMHGPQLNL